jgi:hypothetical protein
MALSRALLRPLAAALLVVLAALPARAQSGDATYTAGEIVSAGHQFFGTVSGSLAALVERAIAAYGLPNGYIVGQEGSGAIFGGLRYGDGVLYTKMAGDRRIYWQGPSMGWDIGGDGNRTMMLVYNLPSAEAIHRRYGGVNGSAYLVGGLSMTVLANSDDGNRTIYVVPIRTGVGARLGINVGYLKFTAQPTWNPF